MSRIHNKNAKILIYGPEKETVTGLVIVPDPIEVEVSSMDIEFTMPVIKDIEKKLGGLKDASGEFTGYLI